MDNIKVSHTFDTPIETSIEYEKKRRSSDDHLLEDSDKVSTSVSQVNVRSQESYLNQLFGGTNPSWGKYNSPEGFNTQSEHLFGPQLTPTCSRERLDAASFRIQGILTTTNELDPNKSLPTSKSNPEVIALNNNATKIQSLLKVIQMINESLAYCNGERARFQKG